MDNRMKAPAWPSEVRNAADGEIVDVQPAGGKSEKIKRRRKGMGIVPASSIKPVPVDWLWEPYIPCNMLTMIDGDPGIGKTYLMCAMAAKLSKGQGLPGQLTPHPPCNVLIMTMDDSLESTIVIRLAEMQADMKRVFLLPMPEEFDERQLKRFEQDIRDYKIKAAFIDPLFSFIGNVDVNKAGDVQNIMKRLARVADANRCAIVPIRHLRKNNSGSSPAIYQGVGSIAFTGQARSVLMVKEDEGEDALRVVLHIKNNVGPMGKSFTYTLAGGDEQKRVFMWGEVSNHKYEDFTKKKAKSRANNSMIYKCSCAIWDMFKEQEEYSSLEASKLLKSKGFSVATINRSRRGMVRAKKVPEGWYWTLDPDVGPPAEVEDD